MTQEWTVPAWLLLLTAVLLGLLVVLVLVVARRAAAATAELREQVADIDRRLTADPAGASLAPPAARESREYVITSLGDEPDATPAPAPVVPPAVFADLVLREGVVQSAALLHGLRRAFAPESRNRIRFAMRQEVKRSRKVRKAEERAVLREWQARRRMTMAGSEDAA